jgi:EpsI family protein
MRVTDGKLRDVLAEQQTTLIPYTRQPTWTPAYRNSDEHLVLRFPGRRDDIQIHIVIYLSQSQGKELIQWGSELSGNHKWQLRPRKTIVAPGGEKLNRAALRTTTRRAEIIYWYAIGRYSTHSQIKAKAYQFLSFLQGRDDASLLAIYYPCPDSDCSENRALALATVPTLKDIYTSGMRDLIEPAQR